MFNNKKKTVTDFRIFSSFPTTHNITSAPGLHPKFRNVSEMRNISSFRANTGQYALYSIRMLWMIRSLLVYMVCTREYNRDFSEHIWITVKIAVYFSLFIFFFLNMKQKKIERGNKWKKTDKKMKKHWGFSKRWKRKSIKKNDRNHKNWSIQ